MRVARAFGRDPAVVAEEPFAMTAWAHLQLLDLERLEELQRDAEGFRAAHRTAIAFNEPQKLALERTDLQIRIAAPFGDAAAADRDALARGLALAERMRRSGVMVS